MFTNIKYYLEPCASARPFSYQQMDGYLVSNLGRRLTKVGNIPLLSPYEGSSKLYGVEAGPNGIIYTNDLGSTSTSIFLGYTYSVTRTQFTVATAFHIAHSAPNGVIYTNADDLSSTSFFETQPTLTTSPQPLPSFVHPDFVADNQLCISARHEAFLGFALAGF